jgi:protein-tyrosine phosphatase
MVMIKIIRKLLGTKTQKRDTVQKLNKSEKAERKEAFLQADMHSHLFAGIDDGVKAIDESVALVKQFAELGYKKLVITPHIMNDFYKNNAKTIYPKYTALKKIIEDQDIPLEIDFAAEYYLDEWFLEQLQHQEHLLTFGNHYILFETAFMNQPVFFQEAVFLMQSQGYKPVFAHPERYTYLYDNFEFLEKLVEKGVLLQMNLLSLVGYYSKKAQQVAERMIDAQMISFVGSDCHNQKYLDVLKTARKTPYYRKLANLNLLNNSLLEISTEK